MKSLLFVGFLLLIGCDESGPTDFKAQRAAENFLDTLYRPNKVKDKEGIGFIIIADYLNPSRKDYQNHSKRAVFQSIMNYNHLSQDEWVNFTKKTKDILSKDIKCDKGAIQLESYQVNGTKYITAFFIDSTFNKVFARIEF